MPSALDGVPLTVYGHSFTPIPGFYCTPNGGEWQARVARRLGMTLGVQGGLSGAKMSDVAKRAIGTARTVPAGLSGVIALEAVINNLLFESHVADTLAQRGFTHAARAFIAAATASARVEASAASGVFGGWNVLTGADFSGGSIEYCGGPLGYKEWSGISSPAGYVWLLTVANDASPTGILRVQVDGVDVGVDYAGQNQMMPHWSIPAGATVTHVPAVLKVPVPPTGTHKIKAIKADGVAGPAGYVYVDALLIPNPTPPLVLLAKDPAITSAALADCGLSYTDTWAAYAPAYHAILDALAAEFPTAQTVDLGVGWDQASMAGARDTGFHFHPGDRGMDFLAGRVTDRLLDLVPGFTPGVHIL